MRLYIIVLKFLEHQGKIRIGNGLKEFGVPKLKVALE